MLRLEHKKFWGNFSSDAEKILCSCVSCRCIFLMWHQKCCKALSQPFLNSWQFRGFEINGMHKRVELPVKLVDLASLLLHSEFRAGSTLCCWEGQCKILSPTRRFGWVAFYKELRVGYILLIWEGQYCRHSLHNAIPDAWKTPTACEHCVQPCTSRRQSCHYTVFKNSIFLLGAKFSVSL